MKKITVFNTAIDILTQQGDEISYNNCLMGTMSKTPLGYKFEESIRKSRGPRNEKVYDGRYCSLVKMKNGKYQLHMKQMQLDNFHLDPQQMAFNIYSEIHTALCIITL